MPDYPIDAEKLLELAEHLVPAKKGRGRPSYTHHRRAVSTAYYAVFHAITGRVAAVVFPTAPSHVQRRARRWINHADIAGICSWVQTISDGGTPPKAAETLRDPSTGAWPFVDGDTTDIGEAFLELMDKRHDADYEHDVVFTRSDTLTHLQDARQAVTRITAATSSEAICFVTLIAMQARIQHR